jgi:hypothetical protein
MSGRMQDYAGDAYRACLAGNADANQQRSAAAQIALLHGEKGDLSQALKQPRGTDAQTLKERELTVSAINGAMAFGEQGTNPPPEPDHWLAPFWHVGRKQAELVRAAVQAESDMAWAERAVAGTNFQSSLILLRAAISAATGQPS